MGAPEYTELDRMGNSRSSRYGQRPVNFLLHTQEGNGSAESLAVYLNNPANGVSYHYTLRDRILCAVVDTDYASWSVGDANSITINLCFAGSYASWEHRDWMRIEDDLRIAAWIAVQDAVKYGFAPTVIGRDYSRERPGISDHQYVTDVIGWGTHTDVGPGFPWPEFTGYVNGYVTGEDTSMPSAADIAKAIWEHPVAKPDGTTEQAGILLGWIDQHAADLIDQMAGPGSKDQRTGKKGPLKPTGWTQLGTADRETPAKPSLIDGVATRADLAGLLQRIRETLGGAR